MASDFSSHNRFEIRSTRLEDYAGIRALCLAVYPATQPWGEEQIRSHLEIFPRGQFVIWDHLERRIVGMAASLIVDWDDYKVDGDWRDFTDRGYFGNHNPAKGRTLYGAEIMVRPDCQGLGLGQRLYAARRELTRNLGLRRIRAGARLRGYGAHAADMEPAEYLRRVVAGESFDPTLSFQLRQGFSVIALVSGYLPGDLESGGWAVVIEWINSEVAPKGGHDSRPSARRT